MKKSWWSGVKQTLKALFWEAYAQTKSVEDGVTFAWIRIFVGLALLTQLVPMVCTETGHRVLEFSFVDAAHGGYRPLGGTPGMRYFGGNEPEAVLRLLQVALGGTALMTVGLFGRLPILVVAVCTGIVFAQNSEVSGGGDLLLGNALFLLLLGDSTSTWSLDAKVRTGRFVDRTPIPAWPRKLALVQLVVVYTATGFQKLVSAAWLPFDNFSALYQILQSPQWTRFPTLMTDTNGWLVIPAWIGSFSTIVFECSYPAVVLWRRTRPYYVAWGILLHIGILALMEVGIFSWLSMALYPALLAPQLSAWSARRWPKAIEPEVEPPEVAEFSEASAPSEPAIAPESEVAPASTESDLVGGEGAPEPGSAASERPPEPVSENEGASLSEEPPVAEPARAAPISEE